MSNKAEEAIERIGALLNGGPEVAVKQAIELIESALAGRHLHESQTVKGEAANLRRFMVLSVNMHDTHEHWIEGFSKDIAGALSLVNGIDPEWELEGVYNLQAELLGNPSEVKILRGARAVIGDVVIGEVWEKGDDS